MSSNKIADHIREALTPIIHEYEFQIKCEHEWQPHGFGFLCSRCDYYSGLDADLNELIKITINHTTNEQ